MCQPPRLMLTRKTPTREVDLFVWRGTLVAGKGCRDRREPHFTSRYWLRTSPAWLMRDCASEPCRPGSRRGEDKMGLFRRKVPTHYIPIHAHNVSAKDWVILLEAGTIVGPSAEKLRVAKGHPGEKNRQEVQHSSPAPIFPGSGRLRSPDSFTLFLSPTLQVRS